MDTQLSLWNVIEGEETGTEIPDPPTPDTPPDEGGDDNDE